MRNTCECIKWKGKLLPEPICFNIQTREYLDADIITTFFAQVFPSLEKGYVLSRLNMKEESSFSEELLGDVIDIWMTSDKNTFSLLLIKFV